MRYIEVYEEKEFMEKYQPFYTHMVNHLKKLNAEIDDFEFTQFLADVFNEGQEDEVRYAELSYCSKEDEDTSITIEYKIDVNNNIIESYDEDVQIESD